MSEKAEKFRKSKEYNYNHFTKLTSTGISPNYKDIDEFAQSYANQQNKEFGDRLQVVEMLIDAVKGVLDCPYMIDEATVPKGGIEVNPNQVVLNLSISLVRYRELIKWS